jgi:hypothetical protein
MDESFVGEIHQIIDNEPVIAFQRQKLAIAGPSGIVVPTQIRDPYWIRQ